MVKIITKELLNRGNNYSSKNLKLLKDTFQITAKVNLHTSMDFLWFLETTIYATIDLSVSAQREVTSFF